MRAIIYARVSSDQSGRGRSVDEQVADGRLVCEREGWAIEEVVTDNDVGASRWSKGVRSGYERVKEVLREGHVLVTWEASRTQRDLEAYVQLRNLCASRGVMWCYSGRIYDLRKGDDRFSTGLDALLAEKASEETRERVLRAVRHNALQGERHGPPPYGYRIKRDALSGKSLGWEPDPIESVVFRRMVDALLAGEALHHIARTLTHQGVQPRRADRWDPTCVRNTLLAPSRAGIRVHHGQETEGNWPPLMSREEYRRIVSILRNPARARYHGRDARHLMSGLILCGVCGKPCEVRKANGRKRYACRPSNGSHVARLIEPVDKHVEDTLLHYVTQDLLAEVVQEEPVEDDVYLQIEELQQRLDEFVDQAAQGKISPQSLARIEATILPELERLRAKPAATMVVPLRDLAAADDPVAFWSEMPIKRQRDIIRAMFVVRILRVPTAGRKPFDPQYVTIDWA